MNVFRFSIPSGDSAQLRLVLTDSAGAAVDLTGWSLTFTVGALSKTSGAGQVIVSAPGNIVTVAIVAGNLVSPGELDATLVATSGALQSTWYGSVNVLSAAPGDLTTLGKVKTYLGIQATDNTEDAILAQLVTAESAWFERQVDQPIAPRTYAETFDGDGGTQLIVNHGPPLSVVSVTVDGVSISERTTVDGNGYVVDGQAIRLVGYYFTSGVQNVEVTYSAGFDAVPADIDQAVVELVAWRYREKDRLGQQSKSIGGEVIQFMPWAQSLRVKDVIASYTRFTS